MPDKIFNSVKANIKFNKAENATGLTHAGNISGSTGNGMDITDALGHIQNWYDAWHPVVWTGAAATVNGHTVNADVPADAEFTDTHVNVTLATTTKAYLLGTSTTPTGTAAAVTSVADTGVFLTADSGRLQAGSFAITSGSYANIITSAAVSSANVTQTLPAKSGTVLNTATTSYTQTSSQSANGAYQIGSIKINDSSTTIYGKDTTYTFAEGSTNGAFSVTPVGGSAQTVSIHGLGSMAYANANDFVPLKPDGTHDLYDSTTHIINSEYLPSYVDDVIEGYYNPADHKFYEHRSGSAGSYTYSDEITGESGKIYVDIGVEPAEPYRWSGSAFVSMKSPTISAVADVVASETNGDITVSYTDGSTSTTVHAYQHPTTAGNKHIPSGGSSGQVLIYGGSSGTASWGNVTHPSLVPAPSSSAAGTAGIAPAPGADTYAAGTSADPYRHYLRADATWSDDPVTEYDTLTLNVVPQS